MTIEDAKVIIRHSVIDMTVTTEMINNDEIRRDPLASAIMHHFPVINPLVCVEYTHFAFDGPSDFTHSRDLMAWIKLADVFDGVFREPINFRIDGINRTITLVTQVIGKSEGYGESLLTLPDNHPEVEDGEYQYPVGKLITVSGVCYALRFHNNQDEHSLVGRFSSHHEALDRLEYANDKLQLKPSINELVDYKSWG